MNINPSNLSDAEKTKCPTRSLGRGVPEIDFDDTGLGIRVCDLMVARKQSVPLRKRATNVPRELAFEAKSVQMKC